jgi:hypothetical protein
MTNFVALFDWLAAGNAAAQRKQPVNDCRLRALPKEEIHLYVKPIDNTRVVRLVDRKDWAASVGMAGGVVTASLLLILLLLPGGYSMMASRKLEQLRSEREQLVNTLKELRVREAQLLSPRQLEEWAGGKFVDPPASSVVYALPSDEAVAALSGKK